MTSGSTLSTAQIATKAKSNLAMALACLPKERKRDMISFYAFCRVVDDIAGPRLAAVHAVGVGGQRQKKLLGAAATRTEIAKGTHDPFAI